MKAVGPMKDDAWSKGFDEGYECGRQDKDPELYNRVTSLGGETAKVSTAVAAAEPPSDSPASFWANRVEAAVREEQQRAAGIMQAVRASRAIPVTHEQAWKLMLDYIAEADAAQGKEK